VVFDDSNDNIFIVFLYRDNKEDNMTNMPQNIIPTDVEIMKIVKMIGGCKNQLQIETCEKIIENIKHIETKKYLTNKINDIKTLLKGNYGPDKLQIS
jgi:uncharacterized protein with von Willebrand factor type A (vWA) domain